MSKLTKAQRQIAQELVNVTMTYRLTEAEGLIYVNSRLNPPGTKKKVEIGLRYYQMIKRKLNSDEYTDIWFYDYASRGFARSHKDRHAEMLAMQQDCLRILAEENSKPMNERNTYLILRIMERIESMNTRLEKLSMGAPVVAKMEALLKEANVDPTRSQALLEEFSKSVADKKKLFEELEEEIDAS